VSDRPLDQRERDELCDLFLELGPDAPTLCEGWTTIDLAAHLVIREREPLSTAGILNPRFAGYTARRQAASAAKGLEALVARLRTPPLLPWRIPGVRTMFNLNEYVVHHEDVRRANGLGPRADRPELQDAIWKVLGGTAKMSTRKLDVGLALARPDGTARPVHKGDPVVTLIGAPVELALYLNGRKAQAQVQLDGPPPAVATVEATSFGV
jgi:uncharacterized protein (TIGR03085 family)